MAEQPSLDGLARKTRRKRNAVSRVPANDCHIAHVVLDLQAAHLGRTFDYLISQDQDDSAQPGAFVRVRFGSQRLTGVIWSRSSNTDTPPSALRFIERVLPSDVLLSESLRSDIDAIAKVYGGTTANILRLAVPQRVARVENEEVFDNIRLQRRKDWCIKLKQRLAIDNDADSSHATTSRMLSSYENADLLYQALSKKTIDGSKSFVVDALPSSQRLAQDLAWMIVTALSSGRKAVVVLPTLREVNDVMRALMVYGLKPYKRVSDNHPGFSAGGFDGDVARLSSADAPAERYRAWRAVASGIVPCVLGTRAAMYAPVEGDALFAIVEDVAYQYADGMMPYAQARGVMRLRAKMHAGVFVAMAYSRSALSQIEVESETNSESEAKSESANKPNNELNVADLVSGSSVALTPIKSVRTELMPWVRWLNRDALTKLADPSIGSRIPHTAVRAINDSLSEGKPVLLSIAQDGLTQSAICSSCRQQARCRRCTGPLDVGNSREAVRCLWCGASALSWTCAHCGNKSMRVIRVGASSTAEELAKLFRNVPIIISSPRQPNGIIESIENRPVIVVATPGAEPRVQSKDGLNSGEYGVVAILDTWVSLYASGLDSRIDTLTSWMKAAGLCATRTRGGSVLLIGETYPTLAHALTMWDTTRLSKSELLERRQAVLPPCVTAACVWGSRDAVMQTLRNIGAMVNLDENLNKNNHNSGSKESSYLEPLPMLTVAAESNISNNSENNNADNSSDANNSSYANSTRQKVDSESEVPALLGVVPMYSAVTDRYQHFDEFDDRVKAVVRVPFSLRQELVDRLRKQVAHHVATRSAGELRFCVDPKDLLAY